MIMIQVTLVGSGHTLFLNAEQIVAIEHYIDSKGNRSSDVYTTNTGAGDFFRVKEEPAYILTCLPRDS